MLAKIINGNVEYANYNRILNISATRTVIQPKDKHFIQAGYKEIIEDDFPTITENQQVSAIYEDVGDVILKHWEVKNITKTAAWSESE